MKLGLTKRQTEVLDVIRGLIDEHGYSPTYEEIGIAGNIKSLNNVKHFVDALSTRGHLVFRRASRRSIALL